MVNIINNEYENRYFNNDSQCNYYSIENLNTISLNDHALNLVHINIRSAPKNLDEFFIIMETLALQFDIIIITETWLKSENDWIDVPGYNAFHTTRNSRLGGGATILASTNLSAENVPNLTCNNECHESVGINIKIEEQNFTIIGTYRPPSSLLNEFNIEYFSFLSRVNTRHTLIVMGDFNVDTLCETPSLDVQTFNDNFKAEHLQSLINLPTRITHHSETCIDHIYINTIQSCSSGVIELAVSDHNAVFCSVPLTTSNSDNWKSIKFREHTTVNIQNYKDELKNELNNFHNLEILSISDQFEIFNDILHRLYFKNFPIKIKTVSTKRNKNPWITNSLLNRIRTKHQLYKSSRNNPELSDTYKNYRKSLCCDIQRAKNGYYINKFENQNVKQTWKSIGRILNPNKDKKKIKLQNESDILTDDATISRAFNEYFSSVANKLASTIPTVNTDPMSYIEPIPNSFVYFDTDQLEVNRIIQSFPSKQSHMNAIPSFIYKNISDIISPTFAKLINSSVVAGIFPDFMKKARVIPIYKAGSKSEVSNYRPISTLPFLSKVYERIMHNRLLKFFLKHNVLYEDQHGFLPTKSTTDAILKFTDHCYSSLNKGQYLTSVFLDFSKAFDTVVHSILCRKLEKYGIRGTSNKWFQSYLKNRTQFVEINDVQSPLSSINCSVPQGSILGPLCFLIYINDMHKCTNLNMVHFADDSTAFAMGSDLQRLTLNINTQLENIYTWLCANKLSLNISKSSFSIYTNKRVDTLPIIKISNLPITYVNNVKFLGIHIDNNLNFAKHISNICSKVAKSLAIIKKLSRLVPRKVLKTLYNSLIIPHIIYGIEVWGGSNKSQLKRLINILNKCLKILTCNDSSRKRKYISL